MTSRLVGVLILMASLTTATTAVPGTRKAFDPNLRITVLFNNVSYRPGLTSGWGFSCLIQGLTKTLLFDTGSDGGVLLSNMKRLDISPKTVDTIILSHIHNDHTGGIFDLLSENANVDVFLPAGFPVSFRQAVAATGARVHAVDQGQKLSHHVYSSGQLDHGLPEQALVLETPKGAVVITGCAHPGIVRIAEAASRIADQKIHLLMGGFHLLGTRRSEIKAIIDRLQALEVRQVAPSHCTGTEATALFRQAWGDNFIEGGLGAVIEVPSN